MTSINDGTTTVTPIQVLGYESSRDSRNIYHPTLGGGMDVTLVPAGLRTGTLTMLFDNEEDSVTCEELHSGIAVLQLLDDDLGSVGMYYVANGAIGRALEDETRALWTVTVPFQEVPST